MYVNHGFIEKCRKKPYRKLTINLQRCKNEFCGIGMFNVCLYKCVFVFVQKYLFVCVKTLVCVGVKVFFPKNMCRQASNQVRDPVVYKEEAV